MRLIYDDENFEDIYANYVISIHKYDDYEEFESTGKDLFSKLIYL